MKYIYTLPSYISWTGGVIELQETQKKLKMKRTRYFDFAKFGMYKLLRKKY